MDPITRETKKNKLKLVLPKNITDLDNRVLEYAQTTLQNKTKRFK